jgi:hypothetical protein
MTKEEYCSRLDVLRSDESAIKTRIFGLKRDYMVSVNAPYKHLLGKKVVVTYKGFFDESIQVRTCYWNGYKLNTYGEVKPMFKQVKKDGTMSSRDEHLYVEEIVSMEEVE